MTLSRRRSILWIRY